MTPQETQYLQMLLQQMQQGGAPVVRPYDPNNPSGQQTPTSPQMPGAGGEFPPMNWPAQAGAPAPQGGIPATMPPIPQPVPTAAGAAANVPPPSAVVPPNPPPNIPGMPAMPVNPQTIAAQSTPPRPPQDVRNDPVMAANMGGAVDPWAAASQQMDPRIAPGAPQTPEEKDRRKAGWSAFLEKLQTDPNAQAMMLRMGTGLMQPTQPGQSYAGHVGTALQSGVDYAVARSELARKAGLEQTASTREGALAENTIATGGEARRIAASEESRKVKAFPKELESLSARIQAAKTVEESARLELELAKWKVQNKNRIGNAEYDAIIADNRLKNAHAGYYERYLQQLKGGAAGAKLDAQKSGAAAAIADFDKMVKAENERVNRGKKPDDPSYQTIEKTKYDVFSTLPGAFASWLKTSVEAAGGSIPTEGEIPAPAQPEVWTRDKVNRYVNPAAPTPSKALGGGYTPQTPVIGATGR